MTNQQGMFSAKYKVAVMAGARPSDVKEVSAEEVLQSLKGRIDPHVLEVATQVEGAKFWRFGTKFFFDDPEEGDPINFSDLRYNSVVGLHPVDEIDD